MTEPITVPEYVAVPAYPMKTSDDKDLRFELRQGPSGGPVGLAFTTVEKLIEQLGRYQPWMILKLAGYRELLAQAQVGQIALDPAVDKATVHWSAEAVDALAEVNR